MGEKISAMRNEAVSNETAYSLGENKDSSSLEQLNYRAKLRKSQTELHLQKDTLDHEKADIDLDNEISSMEISNKNELHIFLEKHYPNDTNAKEIAIAYFEVQSKLGLSVSTQKLDAQIVQKIDNTEELSIEDKIKNYTESIKDGKSPQEILRLLIAKFENEKGVEKLLSNFRNFLKLHQFAKNKPPKERRAIEHILNNADLSAENSFETSIAQISQSTEISQATKLELSREFGGEHIDSVDGFNNQLQEIKSHTNAIKQELKSKSLERETLDDDIEALETELDSLPLESPKRLELEEKIKRKKEFLKETETTIESLKEAQPNNISFQLREGFNAVQNPDGSRSIKIIESDFKIRLPSNKLPFTDTKNLNTINLAFSYNAFRQNDIADFIFRPNIKSGSVPSSSQRKTSRLVLSALGFDATRILDKEAIEQLNKDLSNLNAQAGRTGEENLIELGVFDADSRSLNTGRLKEVLKTIRENRGVQKDVMRYK